LAGNEHPIQEDLVQQCKATSGTKRRFGVKSALDYLIREKLLNFADAAEERPEFARELPRFLAEVWKTVNQYEIAGYVASMKPNQRKKLRSLLYVRCPARGQAIVATSMKSPAIPI
jgi:hypothetical protein